MADANLSKSERESLKAIYRMGHNGREAHTGALAEALKVSPATMTATVKKLAERGLVDHKLYRGVELTASGQQAATAAIRRHRIVERFLADTLGYAWNEADRLACTFEHELPQQVEDRLYAALDRPTSCPHGFPIPGPEVGDIPTLPPLYDLEAGDVAVVAVPSWVDPDIVVYLGTLGVRPGVKVEVLEKHPFEGPLVLRVDGEARMLSAMVARQIYVKKDEPAEGRDTTGRNVE
ncbi:MAG: metal-dependent transcriptional regulator [Actinomycetota bacterium]|nr:metal-dependent transcriptional regulator [Actinomycetota bacterium]